MTADDVIAQYLAGRISPEVALARLVLAGVSSEEIPRRLDAECRRRTGASAGAWTPAFAEVTGIDQSSGSPREIANALARLVAERRDGIDHLERMVAAFGLAHDCAATTPDAALDQTRAAFDRAVGCSPEASVAAYSLGDPAILGCATAELLDWLAAERLIGPDRDVLDLGCGIGRVAAALAPHCRSVLGVDISPGMIAEARRRHALPNVRFVVTGGHDLSVVAQIASQRTDNKTVMPGPDPGINVAGSMKVADGRIKSGHDGVEGSQHPIGQPSFDLVLAVDSFPYLMQAGVAIAERHVADAARLLRQDGALVILNLSYRGDPTADREDAARWAGTYGFRLSRNRDAPFTLWDAAAFVLRRAQEEEPRTT
jgi:SAM-dependent methyltransferase